MIRRRPLALVALLSAATLALYASAQPTTAPSEEKVVTPSGLTIIEKGRVDEPAKVGDTVSVHYTGKLEDGTQFDSSIPRGEPFTFTIGQHHVIAGWEEGLVGTHVGTKRTLIIPGKLGYGAAGMPPTIPGNATLIFDIEVTAIKHAGR